MYLKIRYRMVRHPHVIRKSMNILYVSGTSDGKSCCSKRINGSKLTWLETADPICIELSHNSKPNASGLQAMAKIKSLLN